MVQRKVANRVGIQADHVHKGNLKLGFSQHQDGRNRAADMKKKIRKSRSIKLQDIESLRSSPLQPGKPSPPPPPPSPPLGAQPAAAKQSVVRPSDGSPNYMKSTTSSDARKDHTGSGSRRRLSGGSKVSSASVHRAARTSSLKMVKTLTKTPSFKLARASTKKCSNVALCADIDAHKATCSSTLKDSKFPEYLMLNPGGTEYEGTSVIKVCPYTYCSLNGHHHAPLPPLKCFLSARRRALKVQKIVKLEALSPRRGKLPGGGVKAIDGTPAGEEVDSGSSPVDMDFFIEIYAKSCDDTAGNVPNHGTAEDDGEVADSESDESAVSEIDFGDNMDQNSDKIIFSEASWDGDEKAEADEEYPPSWAAGEITPGYSSDGWESKSETTDMDWEEGQYLMESKHPDLHDEPSSYPDDNISKCFEETISEVRQDVIDDENACFEVEFKNSDSDSDSLEQFLEDDVSSQMSESPNDEQISSIFEELQTHEEADEKAELNNFLSVHVDSSPNEEEPVAANNDKFRVSEAGSSVLKMYLQIGDDEAAGDIESADNPMIDQQESGSLQDDDAYVQLKDQGSDSSEDLNSTDQYETTGDCSGGDKNSEDPQSDASTEGTRMNEEAFIETLLLKTEHLETNQNAAAGDLVLEPEPINSSDGGKEEKEQVDTKGDNGKSSQAFSNESLLDETLDHSWDNNVEDPINSEKDQSQAGNFKISSLLVLEEDGDSKMKKSALTENVDGEAGNMELADITIKEDADISLGSNDTSSSDVRTVFCPAQCNTEQVLVTTCNKLKGAIRSRRHVTESEEPRNFNPREPNYLPLEPDPEAEKVDLRHQMMDERKNSEEWMIDFALRKAVTELAPARKRKVALLVEAFETVLPLPKFEPRTRHTSAAFAHSRPIQACS